MADKSAMRNAKLVEQAACLCSAMASMREIAPQQFWSVLKLSHELGCPEAFSIAWRVWWAIPFGGAESWALACSMLRNGEASP